MIIPLILIFKYRVWLIAPLCLALLLTKSLGGILSLFFGLTIYFCLRGNLKKRKLLFLLGLLIITVFVLIARSSIQKQHLQPAFSIMTRLGYWKDTWEMIKLSPLTGVGLGNFNLAESRYAHNSYLQLWAEMGILGIVLIILSMITVLKCALKDFRKSSDKSQISALISANAAFLVHNFVDFTFFLPETAFVWWIISGLIISKEKNERNHSHPNL